MPDVHAENSRLVLVFSRPVACAGSGAIPEFIRMTRPARLSLGIRGRLFALVGVFAIGCAGLAFILIQLHSQNAYEARMRSLKQLVTAAHGVLATHKELADKGEMKPDAAKKRAFDILRKMWFGKADYFTARDTKGISLLNPASPEREGVNRDGVADSHGKYYSRILTELAKDPGEGFVSFYTTNPDTKLDAEKVTFIKTYTPWDIAIAAGFFMDDLAAETRSSMIQAGGITFVLVLALTGIALWQARSIVGPLSRLQSAMLDIANGRSANIPLDTTRRDEVGEMARAVQVFRDNSERTRVLEHQTAAARDEADRERSRSEADRAAAAQQTDEIVHMLAEGLARLSDGDLSTRLSRFPAGYEKLEDDFNAAVAKLEIAMTSISTTSSAIGLGVSEISNASDDLSRRTEQQAASLEQTAASLEEITATVKKTAEGARFARQTVDNARSEAEQSGRIVRDAVGAMSGIEKSSSEITQIIGVIDEIAFQTNLLALNAGVEAARAGEAGRGFAVVASEVRALAQRSAEAAKQIKALISTSTTQVASGVSLVGQTGDALSLIVKQVSEIAMIVAEIAGSAQEQSTGLDEVNTAVNQMDQITQQNAAMVEEATAASHALRQEAQQLADLISRFRTSTQKVVSSGASASSQRKPTLRAAVAGNVAVARNSPPAADNWSEF